MNIYKSTAAMQNAIRKVKTSGKSIGFVPTMGCLHDGHLSLVRASVKINDITVVSIFVNPNQFNNPEDLASYPRTPEQDIEKLKSVECDIAFLPSVKEIYPENDNRKFHFGRLEKTMEGKFREGHFNGVAQVISIFFNIIKPDRAYFGEKDFQQLLVIKNLVEQLDLPVEIISCPIIRDDYGLAMSSRNEKLTLLQRKKASLIYKTLNESSHSFSKFTVNEFKKFVTKKINTIKNTRVEYFELADRENLKPVKNWTDAKKIIGCIAVYFCGIRLIDNINFNL